MPLDAAEATRLQNAKWGKAAYTAPTTPIMGRLMTANGSPTANGTEVVNSGGSAYAPQNLSTVTPASATNGVLTSNAAATWTNMPAATVVGIEEWSSDSTPRRSTYGALAASKTTALGDSLSLASGNFSDTLS